MINLFKPEVSSPQPFSCNMFRGGPGSFASSHRLCTIATLEWGTPHSQPAGNPTSPPGAAGMRWQTTYQRNGISRLGLGRARRGREGLGLTCKRFAEWMVVVVRDQESPTQARTFPGLYLPSGPTHPARALPGAVREGGRKPESLSSARCLDLPPPTRWTLNSPRAHKALRGGLCYALSCRQACAMILKEVNVNLR